MLRHIRNRFALTEKGAKDLVKGISYTTLMDMALMIPASYLVYFLNEYMNTNKGKEINYYIVMAIVLMFIMWIIAKYQYRSTFTLIYDESENRRISLAEKLRILPLAFFWRKESLRLDLYHNERQHRP